MASQTDNNRPLPQVLFLLIVVLALAAGGIAYLVIRALDESKEEEDRKEEKDKKEKKDDKKQQDKKDDKKNDDKSGSRGGEHEQDITKKAPDLPLLPNREALFCFWNVENLFDDINDNRRQVDERFDNEFANDKKLRDTKLKNLSEVLLAMNQGRGPDILALCEVESDRAVELLQEQLNRDLNGKAPPYVHRLFREQKLGRHIAPALLTRLPVIGDKTRKLGENHHRTLEAHILFEGKQLVVVVSHWTSRIVRPDALDKDEANEDARKKYARVLYGRFRQMKEANPDIDFLICGDFNDDPDDESVVHELHASALSEWSKAPPDSLLSLTAELKKDVYGTLSYENNWHLYDQIVVSPGLLDKKGWTCEPATFTTERRGMRNKHGKPWRFDEDDAGRRYYDKQFNGQRGYADHFPVSVKLKVEK